MMDYKIDAGMIRGEIYSPAFIGIGDETHSMVTPGDMERIVLDDLAKVMAKHQIVRLDIYLDPVEFHLVNKE